VTNKHQRQQAVRAMRGQWWSPGRPSTARREDRVRFWQATPRGASSEDAASEVGVSSAVGTRWYGEAGGMLPITLAPRPAATCRSLSARTLRCYMRQQLGVREIARRIDRLRSTISREGGVQRWLLRGGQAGRHVVTIGAADAGCAVGSGGP